VLQQIEGVQENMFVPALGMQLVEVGNAVVRLRAADDQLPSSGSPSSSRAKREGSEPQEVSSARPNQRFEVYVSNFFEARQ
jgi:hypothetical protein